MTRGKVLRWRWKKSYTTYFKANKYIFSGIYNLKMELCVHDLTYLDIRLKMKQFVFKKSIVII